MHGLGTLAWHFHAVSHDFVRSPSINTHAAFDLFGRQQPQFKSTSEGVRANPCWFIRGTAQASAEVSYPMSGIIHIRNLAISVRTTAVKSSLAPAALLSPAFSGRLLANTLIGHGLDHAAPYSRSSLLYQQSFMLRKALHMTFSVQSQTISSSSLH